MASNEKKWNRPWSMDEMIENAENWSLAGDVALLNTLKAYSEKLFTRTVGLSDNVDNLLHNLDEVSLKLNLSQNVFQSLRNTQFIESRVYEEDETLAIKEKTEPEQAPAPSEEEKEKQVRESIQEGLRAMDKYFDKIEVSISDSEDEETEKSYILRPKDLYADRPLPLIIGSEEWYKKWHVGLASSSSESESEKVSETFSDSDSGDDLPKDLIKGSETSSELDFSSRTSSNRPAANSTFNESVKKRNAFASDDESDDQASSSLPVKTPISSKSFAEQLAAKLGDVISEREDISEEVNRKPIQPAQRSKFADVLFSDEPPPLDELDDTILPKTAQQGLFSGGRGLFDDNNDDDLFWGQQNKAPTVKPPHETSETKQIFKASDVKESVSPKSVQVDKGPFDSKSDSSDDDLFSTKRKQASKKPFLQSFITNAPLFDEEPPELDPTTKSSEDVSKKKPIGGVSIFGKSDLFSGGNFENVLKSRQESSSSATKDLKVESKEQLAPTNRFGTENIKAKQPNLFEDEEIKAAETLAPAVAEKPKKMSLFDDEEDSTPKVNVKPKKIGLFDDDEDLFKEDLFSGLASKKFTSSLFDDDLESSKDLFPKNVFNSEPPKLDLLSDLRDVNDNSSSDNSKGDLFSGLTDVVSDSTTKPEITDKPKKKLDLFGAEEEDLFAVKTEVSNIVEDDLKNSDNDISKKSQVVNTSDEVDRSFGNNVEGLPQRKVIGAEKVSIKAKSLFDDDLNEVDAEDLFKEADSSGKGIVENSQKQEPAHSQISDTPSAMLSTTQNSESKVAVNPYGSSPPPVDDDDWDTKSIPSSDNEEQFSYQPDYRTAPSSLFDNEPPSLDPNESSGIVRDQNVTSLRDTDDSSFNPYASSSRRLSSDIFSDEQSQDSLFVTKNRAASIGVVPQLDMIPEMKSSNLDITPSGNVEDFESSKGDSSVFKDDTVSSNVRKTISLFDDEFDNSRDADNSFSSISKTGDLPKLSNKRLSLFEDIDTVLDKSLKYSKNPNEERKDSVNIAESLNKENQQEKGYENIAIEESGNEKKSSTNVTDLSREMEKDAEDLSKDTEVKKEDVKVLADQGEKRKPPIGSPGKLKHNLRINVGALLPGAAPPKVRELTKSHSLDLPKEETTIPKQLLSPDVGFSTPSVPITVRSDLISASTEKAASFEDALNKVEVLQSVTKDRARIPIKRRPSTRRGRQQAIQSTASDFTVAGSEETVDQKGTKDIVSQSPADKQEVTITEPESKTLETDRQVKSGIFDEDILPSLFDKSDGVIGGKTDNNDFFTSSNKNDSVFVKTSDIYVDAPNTSLNISEERDSVPSKEDKSKILEKSIFGSSDQSVGGLKEDKPKVSIFGSDDSDDELFGGVGARKAKKETAGKRIGVVKKSLFNDSSSDEDLFSGGGVRNAKRKETVQKPVEKKVQKSTMRKLENIEADDDPLSTLLK